VLALTRLRAISEQGAEDPVAAIVSPPIPSVDLLER
jgi:hypothetical protein